MKTMGGLNKTIASFVITSLRYELIINWRGFKMTIPKFRAWVKAEKIMLPVGEIDFDYEFAYLEEENGYRCERDFDEIEFMQFTELKDKNGKEIYEGDVLKTYDGELAKVVWNKELACWEAEFLIEWEAEFLGDIVELSEVADVKCNRSYCEIVGNIWENKEFLEEET